MVAENWERLITNKHTPSTISLSLTVHQIIGSKEVVKCKLEYLPVVRLPPHDNIVKWYMDNIVQKMEEIATEKVFVHEAIYSKIVMMMWLYNGKYENAIPLIGGFHTLLVYLKYYIKNINVLVFKIGELILERYKKGQSVKQ